MSSPADFSVVIPVSEHHHDILALHTEYRDAARRISDRHEFIYVLDGHHPKAAEALRNIQESEDNLRVIQFAKSFGESAALTAGFKEAASDCVITLPAYYQVFGEALEQLYHALDQNNSDVIIASRSSESGRGSLQRRAFNWLVSRFTTQRFTDLGCSARALRRSVTEELTLYGDQHRFLPILARQLGFRVTEIAVKEHPDSPTRRYYGIGTYVRRALDIVTVFFLSKFTKKPLRFFGLIGSSISAVGLLSVMVLVAQRLIGGIPLADRPALMLGSLLVVLGVQFFAIGLIGELIIFTHAKHLKEYQVAETINFDSPGQDPQ